jgi:addiction module HigA family antidote
MPSKRQSFSARRSYSPVSIHPGEHLREDFLLALGMSVNALALALRVPATRTLAMVKEKRGTAADTSLRLARYFNMSPDFWLKLQRHYELALAESDSLAAITREVLPRIPA